MMNRSFLRPLRALKVYGSRVAVWIQIARDVRGRGSSDRAALRRALIRAPVTASRDLDKWCDPIVEEDCWVVTSLGTFHVRANCDDLYLTLPSREAGIVRTMRERLRPGDWFVDAGANIGAYTIFGARLQAKVIAVEMMPGTADILRRHVRENDASEVIVVEAPLSDAAGQIVEATVEPGKDGSASIAVFRQGACVTLRTTTLTDVLRDIPSIRLVKLDLEGAELAALQGAPLDKIEAIIFEDWGGEHVSTFLADHGFEISRLDGNNSLATRTSLRAR